MTSDADLADLLRRVESDQLELEAWVDEQQRTAHAEVAELLEKSQAELAELFRYLENEQRESAAWADKLLNESHAELVALLEGLG